MLKVDIKALEGSQPTEKLYGTITYDPDTQRLSIDPDDENMRDFLGYEVYLWHYDDTGEVVDEFVNSKDDPERWIRNLNKELRSHICWATAAVEV